MKNRAATDAINSNAIDEVGFPMGFIYISPLTTARESATLFSSDRENENDH